jgi:hypothetical protein
MEKEERKRILFSKRAAVASVEEGGQEARKEGSSNRSVEMKIKFFSGGGNGTSAICVRAI